MVITGVPLHLAFSVKPIKYFTATNRFKVVIKSVFPCLNVLNVFSDRLYGITGWGGCWYGNKCWSRKRRRDRWWRKNLWSLRRTLNYRSGSWPRPVY